MSKILAGYILAVAAAHEAAYDKEGSDAATDAYMATAEKAGDRTEVGAQMFVDYAKFQTKTIYQCAEEIVPHLYRQPVYLLLQTAWNDALDWANTVMKPVGPDKDGECDFRLGIETPNGIIDYQLSAQNELCAAFKLGQIFNEDLSIETVKLL